MSRYKRLKAKIAMLLVLALVCTGMPLGVSAAGTQTQPGYGTGNLASPGNADGDVLASDSNTGGRCICEDICSEDYINTKCPVCADDYEACSWAQDRDVEDDTVFLIREFLPLEGIDLAQSYWVGDEERPMTQEELLLPDTVLVRLDDRVNPYELAVTWNCIDMGSKEPVEYQGGLGGYSFLAEWEDGSCELADGVDGLVIFVEVTRFPVGMNATRADVENENYSWDAESGILTVKTNAGTTDWRDDENIIGSSGFSVVKGLVISEGVTIIGYQAFYKCSSLKKVTIPESLTSIYQSAFNGCSSLAEVSIPKEVDSIGTSAFAGCSSLKEVTIPEKVTVITVTVFAACSSLTKVTILGQLGRLDPSAFDLCEKIKQVTVSDGTVSVSANPNGAGNPYIFPIGVNEFLIRAGTNSGREFTGWSGTESGIDYPADEITTYTMPKAAGMVNLVANFIAYDVTLTVNKNGGSYNGHGKTFTLNQSGTSVYTGSGINETVVFSDVAKGQYDLYDGSIDTGINITVDDESESETVNYYTVQFAAENAGAANGSGITATYDGSAIDTGAVVLSGKTLTMTATGAGADSYTYLWSGSGTNGETDSVLTKTNLSEEVNATCKITGSGIVTLTIRKDGEIYTGHGKVFSLQQSGTEKYVGTGEDGTVTFEGVAVGIYDLYEASEDTGIDINKKSGAVNENVDYYTVQFAVADSGTANGSGITAKYDGVSVLTGAVVLGGKTLELTARGAGADSYTYAWSGIGTSGETTAVLTIDSLSETVDAICTVTGTTNQKQSSGSSDSGTTSSDQWQADENGSWRYYTSSGGYVTNAWVQLSYGETMKWYYFGEDGYMSTGWFRDADNSWYYLNPAADGTQGTMQTGWHQDPNDGNWYYLDPATGRMAVGWVLIDGSWYYFNETGSTESGWYWDAISHQWIYEQKNQKPLGMLEADKEKTS